MKYIYILIVILILYSSAAASEKQDSLRTYRLGDVIVMDEKAGKRLLPSRLSEVKYYQLQETDVVSFSELGVYLPSAKIRTNSRGETMLYIRGSSERQLGLFFDGAQMNIPWDNRMDLTFVPVDIIGKIFIDDNSSSIMYGPNVLGGAMSISTVERVNPGIGTTARLQLGDMSTKYFSLLNDGRFGDFNYIANISYLTSDGFAISQDAPDSLANQNPNSSLRSNSDQKRLNAYLRGEYMFSENTTVGLSVSYTNQEKGVPAETHLGEDARFWRYPERNRLMITLNGEHIFSKADNIWLKGTLWYDIFNQEIESFTGFDYSEIDQIQKDDDLTLGGRIALNYMPFENHNFSIFLNGFASDHKEQIDADPESKYTQNTMSTGLEYGADFGNFLLNAGLLYDFNAIPKTGIFTENEGNSVSDYGAYLSAKYYFTDDWQVFADFSRRTRFPTMREAYSGALGKFKVNPDLKAETGILAELGIEIEEDDWQVRLSGFANLYDDLIIQKTLPREIDSLRRKMRFNIADAEIIGGELSFYWHILNPISIEGFFTYMNSKGKQEGEELEHLENKPDYIGGLALNYSFDFGLKATLESELRGTEYQTDADGNFEEIESRAIFNVRLAYSLTIINGVYCELFVRGNNLFDTYYLSQLGLPEPGRIFTFGLLTRF